MKNYLFFVGIDVSKLKLDVTFLEKPLGKKTFHFLVSNDVKGIKEIVKQLNSRKIALENVLVSFEDTGVYSLPLGCYLTQYKIDYWMIPAIEIKRSKGISRGKTDKNDSKDIAFYALTHLHKLRLTQLPELSLMELKLLFTEREKLLKTLRIIGSTSEGIGYIPKEAMDDVLKINKVVVKQLQKAIEKVEQKMKEIIQSNEQLKLQNELIQSIPGVGPQTALYIILVTKSFQSFENWRQVACYAGVAPFEYSSGSSIKGRTKVNHLADKKLKSLLNMCALNSKKHDTELKQYYERKVAEGKSKMLVLNNIRCKLLGRIFATINRGTPYVNIKKFAA
ncbi:IS110 family transposase [Flavobacterium marginilacus]|uniref:IS110 family transposase n=1 Tax=Flavobacterium marginilacus TaxID=3003256 RepID=UPI00248E43ED|nr:IS110 family transposase [Flavobacterium marginilacus]